MTPRLSIPVLLSLATLSATPVRAQDWTRFRGPNGTGISAAKTVPATFTEKDYNWRVELPGHGHSSPVLWGKKIFLLSADEETGKRYVLCVDAKDGKLLWKATYDFSRYTTHKFNNSAAGTAAVDAERVYVELPSPQSLVVVALDHNGKQVWQRDLGAFETQHGGGSSPILVDGLLIVDKEPENSDGAIYGLDPETGEIRWQHDRPSSSAAYATPFVYEPQPGKKELIFASQATGITSLDPKTGKMNWQVPGLFKMRCVGSPILAGGIIFQTTGNGGGQRFAVAVSPPSAGNAAKVAYQLPPRGVSYVPSPIVVGGLLYMWGDGGIVTCLKPETGEIVWMERVGGDYFGSPVCVDGKLYAADAKGELVTIEAGPQFKMLGRSPLGEASNATPAVADGVMYIRTERHLISVGGRK